jgi:succinate-semialdehyde dehydrogenase/glutarate-semialdehyde dehydrogenase
MLDRRQNLGELITNEMGKPLKESFGEIDKSASMIDYYSVNAEDFLADEDIPSRFRKTTVVQ